MKFLKYFFYALLPVMLLMMLFSYNSFSFLGSKASASSTTNTINFYGNDNYLIGSYEVPNGLSINDTSITTTDTIYNDIWFDALSSETYIHKYGGNIWDYNSSFIYHNYSVYFFPSVSLPAYNIFAQFYEGYMLPVELNDNFTLSLNISSINFTNLTNIDTAKSRFFICLESYSPNYMSGNMALRSYTLYDWTTFDNVSSLNNVTSMVNASYDTGFTYYLYFRYQIYSITDTSDGYPDTFFNMSVNFNSIDIVDSVTSTSYLSNVINQDIADAEANGFIDLQSNYSWSSQSNYNNDFNFDTLIFYDLDLYYLQDNKLFNFANGWQSTLGGLSSLSFSTTTALDNLITDFNTFNTLNFNGNFLHVLKTIGLAIANIFNVIISLAELIVSPLIDLVSIIVLLFTKSSFFWTFT